MSTGGTIKISKSLKWLYLTMNFVTNILLAYYFGYLRTPPELRNDPHLFLGYLKGAFFSLCFSLGGISPLLKSQNLPKIVNKLNDMGQEFKFNSTKLKMMLLVVSFEIFACILINGVPLYFTYNDENTDFTWNIMATLGVIVTKSPLLAAEIFFINTTSLINEYFKIINQRLRFHKDSW